MRLAAVLAGLALVCIYSGVTHGVAAETAGSTLPKAKVNKRPTCGCKSYVCLQELCGTGTQVNKR